MVDFIKVLATINLFFNERSRKTPFTSGYRPLFNFSGAQTKVSGSIKLIDMDSFSPGSKGDVEISFIKGMIDDSYFKSGMKFTFDEGGSVLGEGWIK
ncbi:hypothetical protein [Chitinophaga solisilvae]|uniref:hypothetical protein n=1 Tax=Chitinophaga solisilvae TaxID=1233460 RepID=UPI001367B26B|nr:hypothetical protein [Chitinophaga solisilvae]